jgi:hypothetical protein
MEAVPCTIDSLGYLITENDKFVTISADKDHENEDDLFGRSQVIPKGVILKIQYLDRTIHSACTF